MNPEAVNLLRAMGHEIDMQRTMGSTQSIQVKPPYLYGASDPRRPNALSAGTQ